YASDTAEIDIEFLSKDYDRTNNSYPINLIINDSQSGTVPKSAKKYLPFDPTADFHEYRFDFVPDFVDFFADNQPLARLDGRDLQASSQPGHLVLQHWSNGDTRWSGGPPAQDALMTVAYVEAYFNSLSAVEKSKTEDPCPGPEARLWLDRVCRVPDTTTGNETQTAMGFTH
ncbi:concanavalin A-like lectin/glucanase domain-containing protein, partial [Rhypophila decipiens]